MAMRHRCPDVPTLSLLSNRSVCTLLRLSCGHLYLCSNRKGVSKIGLRCDKQLRGHAYSTIRPSHHRNDAFRAFPMRNYLEGRMCRSLLEVLLHLGRGRSYFQRIQTKMDDDALRVCAPLTSVLSTLRPNAMPYCSEDYTLALHIERASESANRNLGNHTELRRSPTIR